MPRVRQVPVTYTEREAEIVEACLRYCASIPPESMEANTVTFPLLRMKPAEKARAYERAVKAAERTRDALNALGVDPLIFRVGR
jgi:hypothetical protein